MARTESTMMPLGTLAPNFQLPDTISGDMVSMDDIRFDLGIVVMFICNHCPYVVHVIDEMVNISNDYSRKGFAFVAISSNDVVNYPQDGPDKMKEFAHAHRFNFPYLYDESQEIALAYQAVCTPDIYLFDQEHRCVYRGRLDAATPGNGKEVNGADLRRALDQLAAGMPVFNEQFPSMGCNIKWKN